MTPAWMFGELEKHKEGGGGGGGGKPRIRLGKTGPRGRHYGKAPRTARSAQVVVKASYARAGRGAARHIGAHLRYIEERERGEKEKERDFFDRDRGGIERKDVERAMLENQGNRAAMHKLILSPGDNSLDLRDFTRESMEALEDRLGHKLDWYAVIHENTEHHHAHVVIAGKIPDRERAIERREAREDAQFFDRLIERELADTSGDRLRDLLWEARTSGFDGIEKALEREEVDPNVRDLLPERERSPDEIRTEKMLDRYEREMAARERAGERGDVYLDRWDLKEVKDFGNSYLDRERSVDREIERSLERELGREYMPEREREIERDRGDMDRWEMSTVYEDRELTRESDDSSLGRGRGRGEDDDDEQKRERDRGDEFDRGR